MQVNVQPNYGAGPGPSDTLFVNEIPVGQYVAPVNPASQPAEPFVNELPELATSDHVTPGHPQSDEPFVNELPEGAVPAQFAHDAEITDVSTATPFELPLPPPPAPAPEENQG